MNELIENDFSSILTQITPVLSREPSLEPICVTFLKDVESEINVSSYLNELEVKLKIESYYKIGESGESLVPGFVNCLNNFCLFLLQLKIVS